MHCFYVLDQRGIILFGVRYRVKQLYTYILQSYRVGVQSFPVVARLSSCPFSPSPTEHGERKAQIFF